MKPFWSKTFWLAIWCVSLAITLSARGQQRDAAFNAYCNSINLSVGTVPGSNFKVYFTTYDGSSSFPLYDNFLGLLFFSGEVTPKIGQPGNYQTDYVGFVNDAANAAGTVSINLPTIDSDQNGIADFLQKSQRGDAAFSGTVIRQIPSSTSAVLNGSIMRAAGSVVGSYTATVPDLASGLVITYRGESYLLNASGVISYNRGNNLAVISVNVSNYDGTTTSYSSSSTFSLPDSNTVSFPASTTFTSSDLRTIEAKAYVLKRTGKRFLGAIEFQDGNRNTTWKDYTSWQVEIVDSNDSDGDGIPDLSDNTPFFSVPTILVGAASQTKIVGQAATLSVQTSGTGILIYQWKKSGVPLANGNGISGATTASLSFSSVQLAHAGDYSVTVSNSAGSVTSSVATLTVSPVVVVPSINTQPQSLVVTQGQPAQFSVQASGTAPIGYQWQKGGVNIAGATTDQFTLKSVTLSDAGEYRVVVSNSAGSIASTVAMVTVLPANTAPVITSQPVGVSIVVGQPIELTVVATGIPTPRYQWKRDGVDLAGGTESTWRKPFASFDDSGSYQVLVSNAVGQVLSTRVTVTVETVGPTIPVAKLMVRLVPEVTIMGEVNSQWVLEWATSLTPDAPWSALTNLTLGTSGSQVIDLSETQPGRFYRSIGGYVGVPATMSVIPAGPFQMGAEIVGSEPVHTVNVSKFVIDRYEVSKTLWDTVRNWAITRNYNLTAGSSFAGEQQPVHSVNWYDAIKWCNARSEMEGIAPAYYLDVGFKTVYRSGESLPYVKKNTGYRLPTEAEWEKAARGGYYGQQYPWPESISINLAMANYKDSQVGQTTAVSSYPPNGYGIYNVAGNVWEWCWDYYGAYSAGNQTDPLGASQGNARVIRGGGWDNVDNFCRVFSRISNGNPTSRGNSLGFRTVRSGQ